MRKITKKAILLLPLLFIVVDSSTVGSAPNKSLKIGIVKRNFLDGCGCYLQFSDDYKKNNQRYIFLGDLAENAQMNIGGEDLKSKLVSRNEPRGETKVGSRWSEVYVSGEMKVRVEYVVRKLCAPNDEACEATWYSATIAVNRNGLVRKVNALGLCGC